jgi:DNA-binding response OmpR family regulator
MVDSSKPHPVAKTNGHGVVRAPCLLIVDDDAEMRAWLAQVLRRRGYQYVEAATGPEALSKLQANGFDLVLLDLHLPGVEGTELIERAQALPTDAAIIVLTARPTLESAVAAVRVRAVIDYLIKPVPVDALLAAVERALEERGMRLRQQRLFEAVSLTLGLTTGQNGAAVEEGEEPSTVGEVLAVPPLILDLNTRVLSHAAQDGSMTLTEGETMVLAALMRRPRHIWTCRDLAVRALGYTDLSESQAESIIRPTISRLRHKLDAHAEAAGLIRTIRGRGYHFAPREMGAWQR